MTQPHHQITHLTEKAVADLMEYADSVLILLTYRDEKNQTHAYQDASGNFYATLGQVTEWLASQTANVREDER